VAYVMDTKSVQFRECVVRRDVTVTRYNPVLSFISYCSSDPMPCFCSAGVTNVASVIGEPDFF
jgi:hypothetical protein